MDLAKFNRLEGLKFLASSLDTADEFAEEYEKLLHIATGDNEMLMSMKQILMGQVCFLMNKHIALQKECR